MKINYGERIIPIDVEKAERVYCAKYIGDFALNVGYIWTAPRAIFYVAEPSKPEYSNYIALKVDSSDHGVYISDGSSAFSVPIVGVIADDGEIIYSRYRHDYRISTDGSVWIDGGRDYVRSGVYPPERFVKLIIDKDKLVISE